MPTPAETPLAGLRTNATVAASSALRISLLTTRLCGTSVARRGERAHGCGSAPSLVGSASSSPSVSGPFSLRFLLGFRTRAGFGCGARFRAGGRFEAVFVAGAVGRFAVFFTGGRVVVFGVQELRAEAELVPHLEVISARPDDARGLFADLRDVVEPAVERRLEDRVGLPAGRAWARRTARKQRGAGVRARGERALAAAARASRRARSAS